MANKKITVQIPDGGENGGKFKIMINGKKYWVGPTPQNSKPGDNYTFNSNELGPEVDSKKEEPLGNRHGKKIPENIESISYTGPEVYPAPGRVEEQPSGSVNSTGDQNKEVHPVLPSGVEEQPSGSVNSTIVEYQNEEDMKKRQVWRREANPGEEFNPDMEGVFENMPRESLKGKFKKNVFYVRFHTNYMTPFKLKGQEIALTSTGETNINKKLRTWSIFNEKKNNVYFYGGMVLLSERNEKIIFENVVKKLFKNDLKTLIFDQFSLDEEAANVIGERLKEIKDSTVLDMVVLNLLEVPSIIKILKCLADSKIKIKKLIIRRVKDTIGKKNKDAYMRIKYKHLNEDKMTTGWRDFFLDGVTGLNDNIKSHLRFINYSQSLIDAYESGKSYDIYDIIKFIECINNYSLSDLKNLKDHLEDLRAVGEDQKKWKEITLKRVEKHILWIEENVGDNRDPSKLRLSAEHLKVYENIGIYYQNFNKPENAAKPPNQILLSYFKIDEWPVQPNNDFLERLKKEISSYDNVHPLYEKLKALTLPLIDEMVKKQNPIAANKPNGNQIGGLFDSEKIMVTTDGSANLDLTVLELVRVIKSSSLTLQHLELPGQFGTNLKISDTIREANTNKNRIKSGVGLMNVIYNKGMVKSSPLTKTERKEQKRVFIEKSVEMIRDQLEDVKKVYDKIFKEVEAETSVDLLNLGYMHTIETFINPEEGIVNDLRQSIKSLDRSTKTFLGKMPVVKNLLGELKELETKINQLKKLEAYKEQLFEYKKILDDKKTEKELQDLEDKSKKHDALKRGYAFDKEASISLKIKHDIFDKMKPEKDSMIVRYNDEWNVPEINFENPDKYRTGKKKYEYKFNFPTSVQKKEAYTRALRLRVDENFFDNSIKVNYTNKTGEVIAIGKPINLTHPVYLVPISIQNPYTDNIDKGETVRLYLRGKVYKYNQMQTDDSKNFRVLDNNTMTNIVMIGIKDTELTKFSIEDIKNNIMVFESRRENLASLYDTFNMLKKINPTMKINPGPLNFFNHEQFYIKSGICKRIFYEENVDTGDIIDDKVDYKNVFVFVYNSSLVSNRDIRINKEYGTIYANLEKVENASLISYLEVKTPVGAKKIKENKRSKINFGRKGSEIYIMSVADLEATIGEYAKNEAKLKDAENTINEAMLKAKEDKEAKEAEEEDIESEGMRYRYRQKKIVSEKPWRQAIMQAVEEKKKDEAASFLQDEQRRLDGEESEKRERNWEQRK